MPPLKINPKLLPMKIHYFLFSAGTAPILLFGSVISKQLGYSAVTVGFMYTLVPLLVFILKPLICACADKYKQRRKLYLLTLVTSLISTLSFALIPAHQSQLSVNLNCHQLTEIVSCDDSFLTEQYEAEFTTFKKKHLTDFTCKLTCSNTPHFTEELCQVWKVNQFCFGNPPSTNSIPVNSKDSVLDKPGKSSIVKPSVYQQNNDFIIPKEFSFQATVSSAHTSKIKNCIYSEVRSAQFNQNNNRSSQLLVCRTESMIDTKCNIRCPNVALMDILNPTNKNVLYRYEFWLLFFLILLNWVSMAVNTSISDTVCFSLLGNESDKYGQTRLFGSLGWGLSSFFFGWIIDHYSGNSQEKNYFSAYVAGAIFMFFNILVGLTIQVEQKSYSPSIGKDVRKLFSDIRIVIFTLCCFYVGICSGLVWSFLFWHLEDISTPEEKLWSKTLQGLDAVFSTVLGELPFFFISGYIIKKISHVHSMSLVLLVFSFRLLFYASLTRPVWVLPVELLNGFTYGIFYAVMTSYASVVSPHGTEATVQGVFGASFDCFGNSLGSLIGGLIYHQYKGAVLYSMFGLLTLFICCLHVLLQRSITKKDLTPNFKGTSVSYSSPTEACNMMQNQY